MPYAIPTHTSNPRWQHYRFGNVHYEDVDTSGYFHYKSPDIFYDNRPYDVSYHEIPYHENIIIEGHFQSWKYWLDYIDEIRELILLPDSMLDQSKLNYHDYVFFHLRRGDYLSMPDKLPPVTEDYIYNGITHFMNRGFEKFIGFSDEILFLKDIIKEFDLPSNIVVEFSENEPDWIDLYKMSSCGHGILANSSFSLMAYYLNRNPDKQCTAPSVWTGPGYGVVDWSDVYPPKKCTIL